MLNFRTLLDDTEFARQVPRTVQKYKAGEVILEEDDEGRDVFFILSGKVQVSTHVEQHIEYAGSHGPDMVVLMGEEIVVPGEGAANAGKRIHRRFTDVFRRENGEWRHDLRHANVISIE